MSASIAVENTKSIQAQIDETAKTGGRVSIPAGVHPCGSLYLRSNVELHLEQGAVLQAAIDEPDLFKAVSSHDEGVTANSQFGALIQGHNCENISITGPGTIDGAGYADECPNWADAQQMFRPAVCYLEDCHYVRLESLRIHNSRWWTLHLLRCEDVFIRGVRIDSTWPNSDGIDPDGCKRMVISDCILRCGDDCIVAKSTKGDDCEDISISNCVLDAPKWACFKLGTESFGNFRNISVSNCVMRGDVAFGLYLKDGGTMENISGSQLLIDAKADYPILIDAMRRYYDSSPRAGDIRCVSISNCQVKSRGRIWIEGEADAPLENISIRNINWYVTEKLAEQRPTKPIGSARTKWAPDRPKYELSNAHVILINADVELNAIKLTGQAAGERELHC